jgi:hypothetical protein
LRVATEMMKPRTAIQAGMEMWKPRSARRSLDQETSTEIRAPIRYGGAVHSRVTVLEPKPKPVTMEG